MTEGRRFVVADIELGPKGGQTFLEYCDSREEAIEKAKEAIAHLTPQERRQREIFPAEEDADGTLWDIQEVSE